MRTESGDLTYIAGSPGGDSQDTYVGFDRFNRILAQTWGGGIDSVTYGYDRGGNRLWKKNELQGNLSELYQTSGETDPQHGYDPLGQLMAFSRGTLSDSDSDTYFDTVSSPARTQAWSVDAVGNFPSVSTNGTPVPREHNRQNQLTEVGANALTYDANGNMTTDETGREFTWDAWGRMVDVDAVARYAYDALNRRIREGELALYYSSSWQLLEERDSGDPVAQYVWSPVYVDALVLRDRDADVSPGNGLEQRRFVLQDANWNVTSVVRPSGKVESRFIYDPYGQAAELDEEWSPVSPSGWVYLHQGGRLDAESGLYHFRNRDYSPTLMRWVREDPIGFGARDLNLFRALLNNTTSSVDPMGLWSWKGDHRQKSERATMIAEDGDDLGTAAMFARLDSLQPDSWLRDNNGKWVGPDGKIVPGCEYTVPNTIIVAVGDPGYVASPFVHRWAMRLTQAAEEFGFKVVTITAKSSTKEELLRSMKLYRQSVWGVVLVGHGYTVAQDSWIARRLGIAEKGNPANGSLMWASDDDYLTVGVLKQTLGIDMRRQDGSFMGNKLGLLINYQCDAELMNWSSAVANNGTHWAASGSASALSGPRTLGWWGSWRGLMYNAAVSKFRM